MSKKLRKKRKIKPLKISPMIQEKFETAVSFRQMGLLSQAQSTLGEIIDKAPAYFESYRLAVEIAMQVGQTSHAISIMEKAVYNNPHNPKCCGSLADLLAQKGRYTDAIPYYEKALFLSSGDKSIALDMLLLQTALAYKESGQSLKAIDKLKRALRINNKNVRAYFDLAFLFLAIGQVDDAKKYAILSLEVEPFYSMSIHLLSMIDIDYFDKSHIEKVKGKIESPRTSVADKIYYSFTLYAIFESKDNFEEAFKYLSFGNDLKREKEPYNFNNQVLYFQKVREIFSKYLLIDNSENQAPHVTPIFIVGMPRSGTTLTEQIIGTHNEVAAGGEILVMCQIAREMLSEIAPIFPLDNSSAINSEHLKYYGEKYLAGISGLMGEGTKFITDKMPQNFFYLGLIKSLFPTAKIIHCKRNPIATTFSCYKTLFSSKGQEFANNLEELGKFYRLYEETVQYWQLLLPDSILEVQYEKLIEDQENETRRILAFCGLEWDEKCLDFHKTSRTVTTASVMQVRKPIYKSSISLWKNYEKKLRPLIDLLGGKADSSV